MKRDEGGRHIRWRSLVAVICTPSGLHLISLPLILLLLFYSKLSVRQDLKNAKGIWVCYKVKIRDCLNAEPFLPHQNQMVSAIAAFCSIAGGVE